MKQLDLYETLQDANSQWDLTKKEEDFDKLEEIEHEYERIQEYTTAEEFWS